jgi:hypothetical protein
MSLVENEANALNAAHAAEERIRSRKRENAVLQEARRARMESWARFFKADGDLSFIVISSEGLAAPIPDAAAELDIQATVEFFREAFAQPNGGTDDNKEAAASSEEDI